MSISTCFWIKIKGSKKYGRWYAGPVSCFKTKPTTRAEEIAIKVELSLPDGLFERPELSAKISIPKDSAPPAINAQVQDNIATVLGKELGMTVRISTEPKEGEEHGTDKEF